MMVGAAYGAAVVLTGALVLLLRRATASRSGGKHRKRSMSFGSKALANGVFPEPTEAWKTVINTLMYFDECPTVENVAVKVRALLFYDRFRSAISKTSAGCHFVDISDSIDVERDIIKTVTVGSEEEMRVKVDELCSETFPEGDKTPLFFFYRIQNAGTGRSGLLVRLHHAIGDGMALIGSMSRVFEDANGNPFSLDIPKNAGGGTARGFSLDALWKFITSTIQVITLPMTSFDSPIVFTTQDKPKLTMKNKRRATVYFPVLQLEWVKELKNKAGVTVNDVLLACTAGAIRRYCASKEDPLFVGSTGPSSAAGKPVLCRALMPVAFPRSQKDLDNPARAMRNYFAMISVPLPMSEASSKKRLEACASTTRQLKSSPLALIQLLVQNHVLSLAPDFMAKQTAQDVFSRHTMVFSNLPGPTEELTFAGERVKGMQLIFPNLIPQVIIISYNGGVHFNMNLDPDLVDAHAELPRLFLEECADMARSHGLSDKEADIVQQRL